MDKKVFLAQIIAFELVVVNSYYYEENTSQRQSLCQQTVIRFQI